MGVDVHNLLLGLAWLGEINTVHVRRLWMPTTTRQWVRAVLNELQDEGYVERRRWAQPRSDGRTPIRQPTLWSLTRKGRERLKDDDNYPPVYKEPRARRVAPHDVMTSECVVRIVELARALRSAPYHGLSGLYIEREVRLDPARRRPVMDALIIVTVGGTFDHPHLVPWSRDPTIDGERRVRYALENDRNSETLSVIAGKAYAYAQAGTPAWVRRYGAFPLPIWLLPTQTRLEAVLRTWRTAWPQGKWLMTTDAWLQGDSWVEYDNGQIVERGLFHKTPTLPPAAMR
jgi:protein involved in plasmid replication-relaxation